MSLNLLNTKSPDPPTNLRAPCELHYIEFYFIYFIGFQVFKMVSYDSHSST